MPSGTPPAAIIDTRYPKNAIEHEVRRGVALMLIEPFKPQMHDLDIQANIQVMIVEKRS